jgi:uncharacterized protein (DUF2147 family)
MRLPALSAWLFLAFALSGHAAPSPEGRWKTFDDKTGEAKSIVLLYVENGGLKVRVDSLLPTPGKDPDKICDLCPGERKGKRIRGMVVGWGLREKDGVWEGGHILDPENGKVYRCRITVDPDGKALTVRGYVGVSLLGRSQRWERVE